MEATWFKAEETCKYVTLFRFEISQYYLGWHEDVLEEMREHKLLRCDSSVGSTRERKLPKPFSAILGSVLPSSP